MKKSKKELEFLERKNFLDVYADFDRWLISVGFKSAKFKESMDHLNYHWSHYDKDIDSLYSVECYLHDTLKLRINFLRDRYEHKFMFVGEMGSYSKTTNIEQTKELILIELRKLRNEQLSKLNELSVVVHQHPIVEMQLKNIKKDDVGYIAECVLYNTEFKEVESTFFIDEERAKEIIGLMQNFLNNCQ
jgi:hypothetical protein